MILQSINLLPHSSVLHVVIGAFDGVHLAHQQLIRTSHTSCDSIGDSSKMESAEHSGNERSGSDRSLIFSFEPLPKEYFLGDKFQGCLLADRKQTLDQMGADYTIVTDFESIKDLSENQFVELLLTKADKIVLYSGHDFRMGKKDGELYQGDRLERVFLEDIFINGDICRSSKIRELLLDGEITRANALLGREYSIVSKTENGDKIGRTINFPTINITPTKQITPKKGVYFGEIKVLGELHPAAIYVGERPTVNGKSTRIESHIIDEFNLGEIPTNTPAEVFFIQKIAEEKSFKTLEELKKMLYNYKSVSLAHAAKRYNK